MSIPSSFSYTPASQAYGSGYAFHWKSGGTVGSAYQTGTTLIYKFWDYGDANNDRTIQYLNGVWSDHNVTENPIAVATNSNNQQTITFTMNPGATTHTFANPFAGSGSSSTTFATLSSTTSTPATGTQSHDYVADSVRNITCEKIAAYKIEFNFDHADINSVGNLIYYIRKNGGTSDEISHTFSAQDGNYKMEVTSDPYPNEDMETGDVITLHASDTVQTQNEDGTWSYKAADAALFTFTYEATKVEASVPLRGVRIGESVSVQVVDRNAYPDYEHNVVVAYSPYRPPSTYAGGSATNLTSVVFSGTDKLESSNSYTINGTWTAGKDGVSQTNMSGEFLVYRKTPAPVSAQILIARAIIYKSVGAHRNFW